MSVGVWGCGGVVRGANCELRIARNQVFRKEPGFQDGPNQITYRFDKGDQEEQRQREAKEDEEVVQMVAQPRPITAVQAQVVGH